VLISSASALRASVQAGPLGPSSGLQEDAGVGELPGGRRARGHAGLQQTAIVVSEVDAE